MILHYFEGLIESMLIASFFYIVYVGFFYKEASFKQNRFFLLFGVLLALLIPFVDITVPENSQVQGFIELKTIEVSGNGIQQTGYVSSFLWLRILYVLYFIGVIIFLLRFVHQLYKIFRFRRNAEIYVSGNLKLIYTGKRHSVFSFLNSIFIDVESQCSSNLNIIISHERVHVVQKHSVDLLLFELLAIVQWFNPLVWLYRKTIKQNHEFLADKGSLESGFSVKKYQEVLLQNYSILSFGLANSFNHSLTFKRLIMMKKNNSNKKSFVKLLLLIPVLIISLYVIGCSPEDKVVKEISESDEIIKDESDLVAYDTELQELEVVSETKTKDEDVFKIVEVMPVFPGGKNGLRNFISDNTKYPEEARKNGESGKVYVMFVVTSEGAVENAKVIRGVSESLDKEALRVVESIPATWEPGKEKGRSVAVQFTVPINFQLQ